MAEKKATLGWTKIPNCLIEMEDLPPNLFRVYCVIMAQKKGYPITLKELSRRSNICKNTVLKAVQILADVNMIEKTKVHGYANTYIGVQKYPVDNVCEKIREVTNRWIPPPTKICTPKSRKNARGDQSMVGGCPINGRRATNQWSGGDQSMDTHAREYININKTNYKTNKTNNKTTLLSKTEKKYTFEDWQKVVAESWAAFCRQVRPGLDKNINIDQWANEIRLISGQYNLTEMAWNEILAHVRTDQFWSVNAASVMGLRNKGKSGEHKIVQIISRLPKYRKSAVLEAAHTNHNSEREKAFWDSFGTKKKG